MFTHMEKKNTYEETASRELREAKKRNIRKKLFARAFMMYS